MNNNIIHAALQAFRRHLRQNGIAAGSHIRSADHQAVKSIVIHLDGNGPGIYMGYSGALHGHSDSHASDFAVSTVIAGIFSVPVNHFLCPGKAPVQGAAVCSLVIISRHHLSLTDQIFLPQHGRIHAHLLRQLIYRGLYGKNPLGSSISPVSAGGHYIGIDHIISKPEGVRPPVKRDGFVAGQSHRSRSVLAKSTGIGQSMKVDSTDSPFLIRSHPDMHLHLMAGRRGGKRLFPRKDNLRRASGLPCYYGRINLRYRRLFRAESASDSRLDHTDLMLWYIKSIAQNPSHMERHLGGRYHIQSAVCIQISISPECLHHSLLVRFCMVHTVNHIIAGINHSIDIPFPAFAMSAEIPLIVRAYIAQASPVILRVNQDGIILCLAEIQHRLQHFIFNTYKLYSFLNRLFGNTCHNGGRVTHKAHPLIQNQPVIWACLRIRLSSQSKPFIRTVFISQNAYDSRNSLRPRRVNLLNQGMGMGTSYELYNQTV